MAAKDYKILPGLFEAYIGKETKKPGVMSSDKRPIPEEEILMLIDWYLVHQTNDISNVLTFASHAREGYRIMLSYYKPQQKKGETK